MTTFERIHEERIVGKLIAVDRLILKGHLTGLMPDGAFARFLWRQGVLLKDFGRYAEGATAAIKANAERIAREAGRPFEYLESAHTAARGCSKEDYARAIADRDGITEGLVVVFRALEPCMTFGVRGNSRTRRLEVTRRPSKCLSYSFYYVDRELGFMHVRLQSWFPFPIQVYVNGREYLYKQLNHRSVAYQRHDNAILSWRTSAWHRSWRRSSSAETGPARWTRWLGASTHGCRRSRGRASVAITGWSIRARWPRM
jgi:hypothetical protein